MKILIRDINFDFVEEASRVLGHICDVQMADALRDSTDAIVSPANSFGFMDGGIDLAYTKFFGPSLQEKVHDVIKTLPFQEAFVGQAFVVPTDHAQIKYLIVAPTMRVPMCIHDPADVFLATRAAVRCALLSGFASIVIPGVGTGCGQVRHSVAVKAMESGILRALEGNLDFPKSWQGAMDRHRKLIG
jgi:O-acetyl-ADP-ribose deacetylase (regulator of RNase III)